MKTRKVGKIVSLLVAIVLVATIMIPAAGVLADNLEDGTYRNTAKSITTLDELHNYINRASNAEIYSAERPILLRLDADIEIPLFYGTTVRKYDHTILGIKVYKRYLVYAAGDYRVNGVAASYDNTVITIPDGTYVSIDLNGHSIKMCDDYQKRGKGIDGKIPNPEDTSTSFTNSVDGAAAEHTFKVGEPITGQNGNQMASVFTVKGFLTIKDTSKAQTGSISGGTGNVFDKLANGNMDTRTGDDGTTVYFFKNVNDSDKGMTSAASKNFKANTVSGGGILVTGANAVLNLEGGNIHDNFVWRGAQEELFASGARVAMGGGVSVENGATFNMSGGKIYKNAVRAYHDKTDDKTYAFGGGVYVGNNSVMNFTGGVIEKNSTYARMNNAGATGDTKIPKSEGGGVYVAEGGIFNMYGPDNVQDMSNLSLFPTIANNTVGLYSENNYAYAEGAGLYVAGYANLRHAVITGNSFPRFTTEDRTTESIFEIETVERDSKTGKVIYTNPENPDETINPNTGKAYEAGDTVNGVRVVPKTNTNTKTNDTWLYGVYSATDKRVSTNGAGVSVDSTILSTTLNVGEQVWVYDNWDLVSTNFKTGSITQDDVFLTRGSARGKAKDSFISLAAPAHESKIGINIVGGQQDRIVGVRAVLPNSGTLAKQFASFVKVFGDYYGNYNPQQTDVQFFWDNGKNDGTVSNPAPDYPVIFSPNATTVNAEYNKGVGKLETPTYLLFGQKKDAYENNQYKGYVMRNYNEADIHYYAKADYSGTTKTIVWQGARNDAPLTFEEGDTIPFVAPLERPNYDLYKAGWASSLKNKNGKSIATAGESSVAYDEITGTEETDLYFKGWEFYAPYGHRTIPYLNFMNAKTKGDANYDATDPDAFTHRFTSKDLLTWNDNELHQSVPAYTAMWYSKTELAAARHDLSVTKGALLIGKNSKVYIRVAALLGGYQGSLNKLQPTSHTAADGEELYFNAPTFVASYTNATPTLEGGYKTTNQNGTQFEARIAKKLISNGTNKKVTLDTWNYVPGNNSAFANDAWTLWNAGKNHHNKNGDSSFLGIMWVDIDTGITYDSETGKFVGDTSKVIYVTPCIEVTKGADRTHNSYYYGESRAYSVAQLLEADGGIINK